MNLAIPNYGWEVVNHSMLLQLRAESIQNSTVYINNIVYLFRILGMSSTYSFWK